MRFLTSLPGSMPESAANSTENSSLDDLLSELASSCAPAAAKTPDFALVGHLRDGGPIVASMIDCLPFAIGRKPENTLTINDSTVSSQHAVIEQFGNELAIRDLGSTNGTFINGRRVVDAHVISEGDLLQLGSTALKVEPRTSPTTLATVTSDVTDNALALAQFGQLLERREINMHLQPIVEIDTRQPIAHEALVRSSYTGLRNPTALFQAASHMNSEVALSQLARMETMRVARDLPEEMIVFLNTHPSEVSDDELVPSLHKLRRRWPNRPVVIEIHEAAMTELPRLLEVKNALTELGMGLAFDDFGSGQSRLRELVEVRPDYVKFDIGMLAGVDREDDPQRPVTATLVEMVRDLNIIALAEGVETEAQHQFCEATGFRLGQGFLYGRPMPARHWIDRRSEESASQPGEANR